MIVPEGFLLLSRSLEQPAAGSRPPAGSDQWRQGDLARAAALLQASYTQDIGRHFAPRGTSAEWLRYVTALVTSDPCGTFNPELTRVVRDEERLRALALTTLVGPRTAHLAQLAVHPDNRRTGIAAALVRDVCARAATAGCTKLTLLVAEANAPARKLYESLGFTNAGT